MRIAATLIINIETDQISTEEEMLGMVNRWIRIQKEQSCNINGFTIDIEDYFSLKLTKEKIRPIDNKTRSVGKENFF